MRSLVEILLESKSNLLQENTSKGLFLNYIKLTYLKKFIQEVGHKNYPDGDVYDFIKFRDQDKKPLGHIVFLEYKDHINIKYLYRYPVEQKWDNPSRGKGIPTLFIKEMIKYCKSKNKRIYVLDPENTGYWLKYLGFTLIPRQSEREIYKAFKDLT